MVINLIKVPYIYLIQQSQVLIIFTLSDTWFQPSSSVQVVVLYLVSTLQPSFFCYWVVSSKHSPFNIFPVTTFTLFQVRFIFPTQFQVPVRSTHSLFQINSSTVQGVKFSAILLTVFLIRDYIFCTYRCWKEFFVMVNKNVYGW